MKDRSTLKIRHRKKRLRNAMKELRYDKIDDCKVRNYIVEKTKRKYRNNSSELEGEIDDFFEF